MRNKQFLKLQEIVESDTTVVPGWWTVGEEAEDAITLIRGGERPLRQPRELPSS
ncbi:MAG: hypothetical protein KME13_25620 [Myxacorys californica WJT36-NPBG1]|nr:hypothetical protein [Myxacorys californica WJT36-NPBG1]